MEGRLTGWDVALALLAYFPILNLVPLVAPRRNRFILYHTRQGLYLFSVFLFLLIVFLGLFWIFGTGQVVEVPFLKQLLAVLTVMTLAAYVILVLLMAGSVLQRRMIMLPVLGELAGER